MSKRIRKWYAEQIETLNGSDWVISEEGPYEAMWPSHGKECWTLAQMNPRLETFTEENPSVAAVDWYARMMASAPMMRHLLELAKKEIYGNDKLIKRIRELLDSIDKGYDQSEMRESWDE